MGCTVKTFAGRGKVPQNVWLLQTHHSAVVVVLRQYRLNMYNS